MRLLLPPGRLPAPWDEGHDALAEVAVHSSGEVWMVAGLDDSYVSVTSAFSPTDTMPLAPGEQRRLVKWGRLLG
jgi:hypothetical protein